MHTSERSGIRPSPALNVHVKAAEVLSASPPLSARRHLPGTRSGFGPDHGLRVRYKINRERKRCTMKSRVLSLLTALCLCAALSIPAFAAQDMTKNQIWVYDGQTVGDNACYHNMDEDSSGKSWSWSAAAQTLTLSGSEDCFNVHALGNTVKATV